MNVLEYGISEMSTECSCFSCFSHLILTGARIDEYCNRNSIIHDTEGLYWVNSALLPIRFDLSIGRMLAE